MRIFAASLLLLALVALPASAVEPPADVTVDVTLLGQAYKSCAVVVPTNSTGGDALDAAVASGCLGGVGYQEDATFGRYVTSIDGIEAVFGTYWSLAVNGGYSDLGIDALRLKDNDALGFDLTPWIVALPQLP